ncbi:NAD-dependent epimerase/dehydratase family protein [Flagellimonas sp. 2504JD1-5]
MKNVLLIGGAGYVGTVVTNHFLKLNYNVTILDTFTYENQFAVIPFIGDSNFRIVYGEMGDKKILDMVSEGISDVIILAGLVGDPITKKYPEASEEINEGAVRACIDYFGDKNVDKLIFISTCSNYGLIKDDELADEEFALNPLSLYAKAKVANEKYLMSKKYEVNYTGVVLRFATAFGLSPRMRFDLSVSEFVRDMYFGKELEVYDEHTWRPYCHVRDFARLLDIVLKADKEKVNFEVFNAGGEINNNTKKMIVDKIIANLPDAKVRYSANGTDPRNYRVSFDKVKTVLGFEPEYTIEMGIKELISALEMGLYADCISSREKYGNYQITRRR